MADAIDTAIAWICRSCGFLAAAAILVLAGLVLASIVSRAIGVYVPGLTDFAAYCLAWAGALGMSYTFSRHAHIRVEILVTRMQGRARYIFELGVLLIATFMTTYLSWYLVKMTRTSWLYQDRSDGSDEILIWIPQVPFAAGFCLFSLVLILAVLRAMLRGDLQGLAATKQPVSWE